MTDLTQIGSLPDGRAVFAADLALGEIRARILTHGARLVRFGRAGGPNYCVAPNGVETLETRHIYHGPIIAPVINRLRGATAEIEGAEARFDANQSGRHTLHSGVGGTHLMIWQIEDQTESTIALSALLPDGAGGFPGNRRITARYSLHGSGTLRLEINATTDAPTLMNPGLHPVFHCPAGTTLEVPSETFLPVDQDALPTGAILPVAGTAHDFRTPAQPPGNIDNNFCFNPPGLRARLARPDGSWLELHSDAPGLQVYDGYDNAIALEPQLWPDAPSHPGFPSILLRPGAVFSQTSDYVTGHA